MKTENRIAVQPMTEQKYVIQRIQLLRWVRMRIYENPELSPNAE